jgi:hypothetical protein
MSMTEQERERWKKIVDEEREAELQRLRTAIDDQLRTLEHGRHGPSDPEPEKDQ